MADDLYAADARAMIRERSLNADSVGKPANGERLANTAALNLNDGTLKVLETLARALDNLYINAYRITDFELGKVGTKLLFFELTNDVRHKNSPFITDVLIAQQQRTARCPLGIIA